MQLEWARGLVVSVTGLPKDDRRAVALIVEQAGGAYTSALTKETTHLVVGEQSDGSSEKLRAARLLVQQGRWQLQFVQRRWILENAEQRARLSEACYPVTERTPLAAKSTNANSDRLIQRPSEAAASKPAPSPAPRRDVEPEPAFELPSFTQAGFMTMADLLAQLQNAEPATRAASPAPAELPAAAPPLAPLPPPADHFGLLMGLKALPKAQAYTPLGGWPRSVGTPAHAGVSPAEPAAVDPRFALDLPAYCTPYRCFSPSLSAPATVRQLTMSAEPATQEESLAPPSFSFDGEVAEDTSPPHARPATQDGSSLRCPDASADGKAEPLGTPDLQPALSGVPPGPMPSGAGSTSACAGETSQGQGEGGLAGVFHGIAAVLDAGLGAQLQGDVAAALRQGGGSVCSAFTLGQGVTHAVCLPAAVLQWMGLGISVVTPDWVLHSLKAGCPQRCVAVSVDTTRHLPGSLVAAGNGHPGDIVAAVPDSADARQRLLAELEATVDGSAHSFVPATMLMDVCWAVSDDVSAAHLAGRPAPRQELNENLEVIPDSEEEEEGESMPFTATQAAVEEVLHECGAPGAPRDAHPADPRLRDTCIRAPALVLLLPVGGDVGHTPRTFTLPGRQATGADLLALIAAHYREEVGACEQLALLRRCAGGAPAALRAAFVEGRAVRRHELLGARRGLAGLFKATREPAAAVFEVKLEG